MTQAAVREGSYANGRAAGFKSLRVGVQVPRCLRFTFLGRLMAGRLTLNQVTLVRPQPREHARSKRT